MFHTIDPEVFPPPSWVMAEEAEDSRHEDHATLLAKRYSDALAALGTPGEDHAFMQNLLEFDYLSQRNGNV